MSKITSSDVAKLAGVSQSAVSRVFSGASASKATQEKVRRAATELGYRPNVLARSLITGRSRIIGLVVAYLENPFYPDVLERMSKALQAEGYHTLIFMASWTSDVDRVLEELLDYQVDGIIAASVALSDGLIDRCRGAGIPIVLFNRGQEEGGLTQVTCANRAAGAAVAQHLMATGHEKIAHVSGWEGSMTGRDRAAGFAEALAADGRDLKVLPGDYDREKAAAAACELVDGGADAIFVGNDHMAFGVIDALRHERGIAVGKDVSVVGFDDVPMAAWPSYDLTTWQQPSGQMVEAAVDRMMALIEGDASPQRVEIEGRLIQRGSSRKET
ncbi:MAG: LacI family DNA-binding transcriptional regulator [Rhodobacteraceae bacterium]|nr:LacI family DNA-binding transcriptional regulator [Paracoccaceae bacterium]